MTVNRRSISVPAEVEERIVVAAQRASMTVSAWIARAALERAEHEERIGAGLAAVREFEQEYGRLPEHLLRRADEELDELDAHAPAHQELRDQPRAS